MAEEHKNNSALWGWAVIVLFCVAMIAWGLVNYWFIKDAPRRFDYGALQDVPAQSPYSSEAAPTKSLLVPRQVPALPEAAPRKSLTGEKSPMPEPAPKESP